MELFDSEFMKKLEYLSLVSRRVFRGQLLAQKRTKQMGGGIEFADHREYIAGDDLRYLDWNIYARHGDLLLKRFQEEQDLHVYLFVDCSRSMAFGDPLAKFDFARQVCAALAYIALADLDRISVVAFSEKIIEVLPLMRGKNNVLSLLRFLEKLETTGGDTDLATVASNFLVRTQRTGLAIVISDFFDRRGFQQGIDLLRHRNYEPHLIQIHDPRDAQPEFLGDVELEDMESGELKKLTITERKLRQYREIYSEFMESILKYARTYGLGCTRTSTEVPFDELILKMMRMAGNTT